MPLITNTKILLVGLFAAVVVAGGVALTLGILPTGASTPAADSQLSRHVAHPRPASQHRPAHRAPRTRSGAGAPRSHAPRRPVAAGFPETLERAFETHRVVVVATFLPGSSLDAITLREARAGARAASAGFVAVDAGRERQISHVHRRFRVTNDPTVLILARPGRVVTRIDGFADAATVAQAVANASVEPAESR